MKKILLLILTSGLFSLTLRAQSDGCAGAAMLSAAELNCAVSSQDLTGNTNTATTLDGVSIAGCIDGTAREGYWYRFTAQGADLEITNTGGGTDPHVMIFDDVCPPTASDLVYCDQLDILDDPLEADDLLITGNTYLLWVGYDGPPSTYSICVTNPMAPVNDECVNARDISGQLGCIVGGSASVTGTTEFAGPDNLGVVGCIDALNNSWEGVWYTFTARGYDLDIDVFSADEPHIIVMDNCDINVATLIFCDQTPFDLLNFPNGLDNALTIGQQYWMWVGFDQGLEVPFEICVDNPEPPVNDDCVNAIDIQANIHCAIEMNDPVVGNIYGAYPDDQDIVGACLPAAANGWEGIWYAFVVEGHDLLIETSGNEDPYIIIYDACPLGANVIACVQTENGNPTNQGTDNDANGMELNNVFEEVIIGTTVFMWVGFDGGLDSTFTICLDNPPPPINDECGTAIDISDMLDCPNNNAEVLGSSSFSSFQSDVEGDWFGLQQPPPCFNQNAPVSEVVWYVFAAPGVDFEISDAMGNNPSFAIFPFDNCNVPTVQDLIVCDEMPYTYNDDDPDDLFVVGQRYTMLIAFPGGWEETDSFALCVHIPVPPPNDLCENAQVLTEDELDCPELPNPVIGHTYNASQEGLNFSDMDPLVELACELDSTEDDGVWYRFTAIGTDIIIEDNMGNNPSVFLMRYTPCEADTVSEVFCETTPISADFGEVGNNATIVGQEYLMYVTFQGGESEADSFELCIDNDGMCNSASPPSSWCQTTPICGLAALDAYCLAMVDDGLPSEPFPGCANSLDNPNWFSFVAGANNLTIEIQVGDCLQGQGIQVGMYEIDCTVDLGPNEPFCAASDPGLGPLLTGCGTISNPQGPGTVVTFNAPTIFGHIYAIVIDGWGPDLCQIEINVVLGADPPNLDGIILDPPVWDDTGFPFEGDTICAGAEGVLFEIFEEVPGSCRSNWTLNGVVVEGENTLTQVIDFPDPGNFEVCYFASNFCDSTEPICIPIVVAALDPFILYDTICEGDDYVWLGPFGDPLAFNPLFTSDEGGDYPYTSLAVNAAGCEIDAELYIHVLEENDDDPTPIDTVICYSDLPFEYADGELVAGAIPNQGVLLDHEFDRPWAHGGECDSFFILDLFALEALIDYTVIFPLPSWINCFDSVITVCPSDVGGNPLFFPDPGLYPDVEIHYQWFMSPSMDSVGTDNECLIIHFNEFMDSDHRFEVLVTMRKGGRPAVGCMFGPFDFELDLVDFIPDSMDIIGPDTVCIGPDYTYTIQQFNPADLWPMTDNFDWDISNFPGAVRTQILPRESEFTFTEIGTGQICVTALDPCTPSATHCKTVVVAFPPPGDPGEDVEECTNTYTLSAGDADGIWYTDDGPFGASDPMFSDSSDPNASVTIIDKGVYTFGWVTNAYGCSDTAYVEIDFIEPMALVDGPNYMCDAVNEFYTAVLTFSGGIAPFVVTSNNGTLVDTTFTSNPIPEGDTVVVLITDAQGCTGIFVISASCACLTQGAEMNPNPIESCGETCVTITPFTPAVPDANDNVVFVLHTNSDNTLGIIIDENTTGEFCYVDAGLIQYGIQYYVSVVVGNAVGPNVDLNHRCTRIAPGQPVIWYDIPNPNAGADDATCDKIYQLNVSNSNYPGRWEIISSATNVTFSDQNSPASTLTALGCGIVELHWIEGNGGMLNQLCLDTSAVTIEFYCNPTNGTLNFSCNMAQDELTVTFELNGVGPFTETNGRGMMITPKTFEADGLPLLTADTFYFVDGNGCELVVPIPEADCNCLPIVMPDTVCGLSITLTSDGTGNGGFWAVSNTPIGEMATIDDVNMRNTNVTVSDYGTYCFRWTEVGSLCQGSAEICIPFVNRPEVDMASIMYMCNANYDGYTISFNISEGHLPSYRVVDELGLPLGSIIGNKFTSREFPSGQSGTILVFDGFGCDTIVIDRDHTCPCFKALGDFDVTPLNLCIADLSSVVYDATNQMTDGNDVGIYILYTDPTNPLTSIIAENPTGVFSFMDPPMILGTTYYISFVLGTELGSGTGQVDYTDPCVILTPPRPVTWYDATAPSITQSELEFTCLIESMNLTVSAANLGDYNIEWSTTNGIIEPGDENMANPQINGPGTYTVTLRHSIAGCPSMATITVQQSDNVPDAVIVTPLKLTCDVTEIQLLGTGSETGMTIRYEWKGPGIIGSTTDLNIMVNRIGVYTLTVIDDANGCEISTSVTVEEDLVEPDAIANAQDLLDCNTTQVTVSGQGSSTGGNITYSWSVLSAEGNIIGSTTGRDIVADETGTYQLVVTNLTNGCTSTTTVQVQADPSVISGANIVVRQPGCGGEDDGQITFASINGGTGPFMYSFDGGATFDVQPNLTELASGTYDLVVTDANGCEFTETVVLTAPFDFSIDLGESIIIELGDTAFINGLTNLPDSLTQSITWNPLYDTTNQNSLSQSFIPDLGQYSINLTVVNTNGCIEQDNVLVVVKFAERLYIPNVMRPSSSNNSNQRIHIFADPESVSEIHSFAIFDRWGERMFFRTDLPVSLDYDPTYAWDGMWQGEPAPTEVYVYYADVEFITGVRKLIKGDFTIVR